MLVFSFHHSEAIDFGTFGQGMLVNWQYIIQGSGAAAHSINFYDHSDRPLHVNPRYGPNVS